MAHSLSSSLTADDLPYAGTARQASQGSRQAYQILHLGFTVAPILAGLDKFFNILVDWHQYLPSTLTSMLGDSAGTALMVIGIIEIVAGIGVALKPRIFAWVVAAWLLLIIVDLLLIPGYYDVALRDFGLMLGAIALARLAQDFDRPAVE